MRHALTFLAAVVLLLGASGSSTLMAQSPSPSPPQSPPPTPGPVPTQSAPVLVGAGDIASCQSQGDEATARLLDEIAGVVFTTGDNVYEFGTDAEFADCYHPSWGRHRARTRPSVGNHEYGTPGAAGYFRYFGAAAGEVGKGYYSYDLGEWHVVVLNSNCWAVGGCGASSPQVQWLRADLASRPAVCTVAYWHHPRFSSGLHGSDPAMQAIWQELVAGGVDVALTGHDHSYERFAPLDASGRPDLQRGLRQIVVGTGGRSHYPIGEPVGGSEVRHTGTYGVLKLTLLPTQYTWEFVPEAGKSFRDSGTGSCHQ